MVVVSPSLFSFNEIKKTRYWGIPLSLEGWGLICITGKDAKTWLQRQLTQDIANLPIDGRAVARLDRAAHVKYYGVLIPDGNGFKLLLPVELEANLREDVEKFVIMEEIQISQQIECEFAFICGPGSEGTPINFFGEEGCLVKRKLPSNKEKLNNFMALCGVPRTGLDISGKELINETRLDQLAVNYDKGCFLGQETAAKVRTRRGANYSLVVLCGNGKAPLAGEIKVDNQKVGILKDIFTISEDKWVANAQLKREWRVLGSGHEFDFLENKALVKVTSYPYLQDSSNAQKAKTLYLKGVKDFEKNLEKESLENLMRAIEFDETLADAYEAIGVMYARNNQHEKAIEWMDRLLEVSPRSVMAHTNKSLAYMKLGQIEKAEEEKSQATVKSFSEFGEQAKNKKEIEAAKARETAELERREGMFRQVLEIDGHDQLALFGLADIYFKREDYQQSLRFSQQSLESSPKHSQSILLKGKSLEKLSKKEEAIEVYRDGLKIASAQGELMPANEMQARLNQLLNSNPI